MELLPEAQMLADFGCGRMTVATPNFGVDVWRALCRVVGSKRGHAVLEKAPAAFARQQCVVEAPSPGLRVMRELKAHLDPHRVFPPLPTDRTP